MTAVNDLSQFMNQFAPPQLAEDWDNVGLLVGDPDRPIQRVMTCLTITPESADEAVQQQADVIVTHHPLPFRPLKRLTTGQTGSRLLLQLIKADVAIISPHTAFDSAATGINYMLGERLGLSEGRPLVPAMEFDEKLGAARVAVAPAGSSLANLIDTAKRQFALERVKYVGDPEQSVSQVALACGSGGSFLDKALAARCDAMVTGEATFHTCLEARASGIGLVLLGHYASERFAVEQLATVIGDAFADLQVWASRQESDPLQYS